MAWKPPASDGGAKIRNYYLEKREKKQNKWISVTTDEIRETVFSVQNLIEGLEYEFRVKCENLKIRVAGLTVWFLKMTPSPDGLTRLIHGRGTIRAAENSKAEKGFHRSL